MSIRLPWRWWQPLARLLAIQVVLTPAALSPSLLLGLLFDVDVVAGMALTCVLIVLGTVAIAWWTRGPTAELLPSGCLEWCRSPDWLPAE